MFTFADTMQGDATELARKLETEFAVDTLSPRGVHEFLTQHVLDEIVRFASRNRVGRQ